MGLLFKILRYVVIIGVFMMRTLGSCADLRPLPFPGALSTGSFGFGPKAPLVTVLAAHLSTHVVSVREPTGLSTVILVASEETPGSPPTPKHPISLLAAQPCPRPIQPPLPTPVKTNNLLLFLSGYDNSIVQYLATGFTMGFPLHYEGPRFSCSSNNLLSAMQNPTAVDAKISKELDAHRLAGPFCRRPFRCFASLL